MISFVEKRDGTREAFDADKLNKWVEWASSTCGVSWNDIVFSAVKTLHDGCKSTDIHTALINACVERKDTGHSKMAARLFAGQIYKEAHGGFLVPSLQEFYHKMVKSGYWEDTGYSEEELEELDQVINHQRNFSYDYATLKQFYDKYAVTAYGQCLESPQFAIMGIAMSNMRDEVNRLDDVIKTYEYLSKLKINLPTPSLNGERAPMRASPSCCVISAKDDKDSIGAAVHAAYEMTAARAGIGTELTTRAPGEPVKQGIIEHGGKFNYYSYLDRAVKANTQVTRGGSATVTYTCMDPEVEYLLRLKSQRTSEDFRLEFMDYSLAVNNLFLKKAAKNEDWMLVSVYNAPDLYKKFYKGNEEEYEAEYNSVLNSTVKKTMVNARKILMLAIQMRLETGRIYRTYIDNVNSHTPFKDEIRLSNLCQEVLLHTRGYDDMRDMYKYEETSGEIALCFLASIVQGNVTNEEYEDVAYITAKFIDNTIKKTLYPFENMRYTSERRRSIGVGMTDVAHWMAKNGHKYNTEDGRNAVHRLAERHSYFLHKASVRLAKERGPCEWMHKTKYSNDTPWLPVDTYAKEVDKHHSQALRYDWEEVREGIRQHGVRFTVLEAYMPVESSSVFTNSTNGVYPIRDSKMFKKSRKGMVFFQAPEWDELKDNYQFAWDVSMLDMAKVYAVIQKFTGQAISSDFYVDYTKGDPSMKEMMQLEFAAAKLGLKTMYYLNSKVGTTAYEDNMHIEEEPDCDNCTL